MMYVEFKKNFLLAHSTELFAVGSFWAPEPKTFDSFFLDMMYVEFKKNFFSPIRATIGC